MAASAKSQPYAIGIDLGGTKMAVGVVDAKGQVTEIVQTPTQFRHSKKSTSLQKQELLTHLSSALEHLTSRHGKKNLLGVGLACTGPVDTLNGELIEPTHFPGWKNFAILSETQTILRELKIKAPVLIQNDAMASALAEGWIGAAKGLTTFAAITLGTGIGTGILLNGRPAQSKGQGAEWGNTLVQLRGGEKPVSIEDLASGGGLVENAQNLGSKSTSLEKLLEEIAAGNNSYAPIFENAAQALAILFFNLSIGFHLEKIVVSGGVLKTKNSFLKSAIEIYKQHMKNGYEHMTCPIVTSKLLTSSGMIGAVAGFF